LTVSAVNRLLTDGEVKARFNRSKEFLTTYYIMGYEGNIERSKTVKAPIDLLTHTLRVGHRVKGSSVEWGRSAIFDVIGDPAPAPRPRAVSIGKHARIYVPSSADQWKHDVRAAAIVALGDWPLAAPGVAVEVYLEFRFPRPKSHLRTGRFAGILKPRAPRQHTQKPDKDNLEKAVLDALGKFDGMPPLVWCDDCQVVDGRTSKRWADPGEEPGVSVAIMEVMPC